MEESVIIGLPFRDSEVTRNEKINKEIINAIEKSYGIVYWFQ